MTSQLVELEIGGGVATVTINRPDRLNALDRATIAAMGDVVKEALESPEVRGILVTGAGDRAFVAGADISELARMTPIEGVEISRAGQALFRTIELSPKPVLAAVNGFALGGGCELALACHLRVASTAARFGFPEVKLGIIPGYGGTVRLPRIVGRGRALEMILTGEMIGAEEAHRIGLVNRVVAPELLGDASRTLLETILANGPLALRFAIESTIHGADANLTDALAFESQLFGLLAATDDMKEGMQAFLEKRRAGFQGR